MAEKRNLESLVKLIFRGLIPMTALISGVVLFVSEVSGWGVILGIPMIVIGMVMLIFTYDEAIGKKIDEMSEQFVRCAVCGKLTPRQPKIVPEDTICSQCKKEISSGIKKVDKYV